MYLSTQPVAIKPELATKRDQDHAPFLLHFFIFVIGEKRQKEKGNDETAVEPWVTWLHEMGVDEGATDCQIISHTGVDTHYAGVDKKHTESTNKFQKECKITTKY